ncbi:LysM peptidoglycan-binding domain-containing protein [Luteipulveratus halotolerans]|uniref:LysM domain-containing protein n=1 Tax=Luteipulveratus halotolerans TaxID=1631356 RepID=A0A0L6CJD1_9MICO|nr:hypothetical protein [Luteipulveratus halotolerans]KNX37720.1 hypothetical protein VV01_12110 [Luteipulveratus halotolerans]
MQRSTDTPRRVRRAHRHRAGLLGLLAAAAVAGAAVLAARALRTLIVELTGERTVRLDEAVTAVALAVMVLALMWCVVLLLACAVELLRPRRTAPRDAVVLPWHLAPDLSMRVTGLLLALTALGSGPAQAASSPDPVAVVSQVDAPAPVPSFGITPPSDAAAPAPSFGSTSEPTAECPKGAPVPGWTPTRPAAVRAHGAEHVRLLAGCAGDAPAGEIVVHRGDDLWSLVERHLGDDADAARVAEEWPRWYAANRVVIGADPNVLQVGQTLRIPEGALR